MTNVVQLTEKQALEVRQDFEAMDTDQDGVINRDELKMLLNGVGADLHDDVINEMMRLADADGDGNIDIEEFLKWNQKKKLNDRKDKNPSVSRSNRTRNTRSPFQTYRKTARNQQYQQSQMLGSLQSSLERDKSMTQINDQISPRPNRDLENNERDQDSPNAQQISAANPIQQLTYVNSTDNHSQGTLNDDALPDITQTGQENNSFLTQQKHRKLRSKGADKFINDEARFQTYAEPQLTSKPMQNSKKQRQAINTRTQLLSYQQGEPQTFKSPNLTESMSQRQIVSQDQIFQGLKSNNDLMQTNVKEQIDSLQVKNSKQIDLLISPRNHADGVQSDGTPRIDLVQARSESLQKRKRQSQQKLQREIIPVSFEHRNTARFDPPFEVIVEQSSQNAPDSQLNLSRIIHETQINQDMIRVGSMQFGAKQFYQSQENGLASPQNQPSGSPSIQNDANTDFQSKYLKTKYLLKLAIDQLQLHTGQSYSQILESLGAMQNGNGGFNPLEQVRGSAISGVEQQNPTIPLQQDMKLECNNQHDLELMTQSPYQPFKGGQIRCVQCRQGKVVSLETPSYGCRKCKYDLCYMCSKIQHNSQYFEKPTPVLPPLPIPEKGLLRKSKAGGKEMTIQDMAQGTNPDNYFDVMKDRDEAYDEMDSASNRKEPRTMAAISSPQIIQSSSNINLNNILNNPQIRQSEVVEAQYYDVEQADEEDVESIVLNQDSRQMISQNQYFRQNGPNQRQAIQVFKSNHNDIVPQRSPSAKGSPYESPARDEFDSNVKMQTRTNLPKMNIQNGASKKQFNPKVIDMTGTMPNLNYSSSMKNQTGPSSTLKTLQSINNSQERSDNFYGTPAPNLKTFELKQVEPSIKPQMFMQNQNPVRTRNRGLQESQQLRTNVSHQKDNSMSQGPLDFQAKMMQMQRSHEQIRTNNNRYLEHVSPDQDQMDVRGRGQDRRPVTNTKMAMQEAREAKINQQAARYTEKLLNEFSSSLDTKQRRLPRLQPELTSRVERSNYLITSPADRDHTPIANHAVRQLERLNPAGVLRPMTTMNQSSQRGLRPLSPLEDSRQNPNMYINIENPQIINNIQMHYQGQTESGPPSIQESDSYRNQKILSNRQNYLNNQLQPNYSLEEKQYHGSRADPARTPNIEQQMENHVVQIQQQKKNAQVVQQMQTPGGSPVKQIATKNQHYQQINHYFENGNLTFDSVVETCILDQFYHFGSSNDRFEITKNFIDTVRFKYQQLLKQNQEPQTINDIQKENDRLWQLNQIIQMKQQLQQQMNQTLFEALEQKLEQSLSKYYPVSRDEQLLLDIFKITNSQSLNQQVTPALSKGGHDFERILLIGYDQYLPAEQLIHGIEKPQVLVSFLRNNTSEEQNSTYSTYVNKFINSMTNYIQCEDRTPPFSIFQNITQELQTALQKLTSNCSSLQSTYEQLLQPDLGSKPRKSAPRAGYQAQSNKLSQYENEQTQDMNIISMLGSDEDESMVLISNFQNEKKNCFLEDFKLIQVSDDKVGLLQTKVAIAVRYSSIRNANQSMMYDLRQKQMFIISLQIQYIQKRIAYLTKMMSKFSISCRNKVELLKEHGEKPFDVVKDFNKCCQLSTQNSSSTSNGFVLENAIFESFCQSAFEAFQNSDILEILACLMTSKKVIFTSSKTYNTQKFMYCIKDQILRRIGFEWPHLFATYFSLTDIQSTMDNQHILQSTLPAMIGVLPEILAVQIIPLLSGVKNSSYGDTPMGPDQSLRNENTQQNPLSAGGAKKSQISDFYVVDIDQVTIKTLDEYQMSMNNGQNKRMRPNENLQLPSFFLDILSKSDNMQPIDIEYLTQQIKSNIDAFVLSKARFSAANQRYGKNNANGEDNETPGGQNDIDSISNDIVQHYEKCLQENLYNNQAVRSSQSQSILRQSLPQQNVQQATTDLKFIIKFVQSPMFQNYVQEVMK